MASTLFQISVLTVMIGFSWTEEVGIESSFRIIFNNYKQCEAESKEMATCLKLKALKLVDRALSINNIPIIEGISLAKREETQQRSLDEEEKVMAPVDENHLPEDSSERNQKLDSLLWDRIRRFIETRSLQLKVNKLFGDNTDLEDGRGKKDKNKGMYIYMMMMKGGMMALAYKGLALLAGKALLVSKIALTLALLVAIKKLFSQGHSQKTTYEIVKTPIITHSHQYSGGSGGGGASNAHYGTDFGSYEGGPYARSFEIPDDIINKAQKVENQTPRYMTHLMENVEPVRGAQGRSLDTSSSTESEIQKYNVPYAHLRAYRNQLRRIDSQESIETTTFTDQKN